MDMLEVADFNKIDMVSPFIGEIVDALCVQAGTTPVTELLTLFFDLNNYI